jgi:hypothetical protein
MKKQVFCEFFNYSEKEKCKNIFKKIKLKKC